MALKKQISRVKSAGKAIKRFVFGQNEEPKADPYRVVTPDRRDKFIVPSGYAFTPADILSYITRAEQGDTRYLYAFMDEMVARDPHLTAELNKAKTALTGADVQILPYPPEYRKQANTAAAKARADAVKKAREGQLPPGSVSHAGFADGQILADADDPSFIHPTVRVIAHPGRFAESSQGPKGKNALPLKIAEYVEQQLKAPHIRLDRAIGALSNGIWKGVGAVEVIVEPGGADEGRERLKALNPIPSQRFRFNPFGTELLLQLSGDPADLAAVTDLGARIAVLVMDADKPSPARRSILRSIIGCWISRMYGPGWWLHFVEIFGSPMRVAKTAANDPDTIAMLKAALEDLGAHQYAVIPDTAKIELVEAATGALNNPPHMTLMVYNAGEISKALLGATQTSDIAQGAGSQATATVHMDVFKALTKARAIEIAATIREQIIMPLVERNFGPEAAAKFCPEIVLGTDSKVDLGTLGAFIVAAKNSGAGKAVPLRWINETSDIPIPEEGEPTLDDAPSNVIPFPFPGRPGGAPGAPQKPTGESPKQGSKDIADQPENGDQTGGRAGTTELPGERFTNSPTCPGCDVRLNELHKSGCVWLAERQPRIPKIKHAAGAGEDIVAPVRAIIARGLKEGASLKSILYQIQVRDGLATKAPLTEDILASIIAEARFRGMQSVG